ncbi:MAG: ribosomal protein S18-alanine N-acetyltransferase [Magnetococcales bacterium]|nr:ribosomal protein S18-alanine N-acetyltransferase [Magnetococcales bacterium]
MNPLQPLQPIHIAEVVALEQLIAIEPWNAEMFYEEIRLGSWQRVVLDEAGGVVGYVVARLQFDEWHLLTLGVALPFRRQGLGGYLVQGLIQEALASKSRGIVLEVRVSNYGAHLLYQKLGFVELSLRKGYYRQGPSGQEDALVMALQIHSEEEDGVLKIFLD